MAATIVAVGSNPTDAIRPWANPPLSLGKKGPELHMVVSHLLGLEMGVAQLIMKPTHNRKTCPDCNVGGWACPIAKAEDAAIMGLRLSSSAYSLKLLIDDEDGRREDMARYNKNKSNQAANKSTKKPARIPMAVKKPNGTHMPYCSNGSCRRRVSDARKTRCSKCSSTTSYSDYGYDHYMYGMD